MRTRFFFLAASVTSIAAAAVAQGCGETETTTSPGDAGADVAADTGPKKDATPPAEDAEPPCDTTQDFSKDIPDAEIADGASTTGICVGCGNSHCKKYIQQCNLNCQCQGLAAEALECYAKTANIVGCAGQFASSKITKETQTTAFGLFSCLNEACKDECATEQFADAGPDGGDAGDGGDGG
jgi:hypothetical protein